MQPQVIEQLVVAEDEVPQAVDVLHRIGFPRRRPRVFRRVHREASGQRVQERTPRQAPGPMEEDHGGALALGVDPEGNPALPDRHGPLFCRHH